jgi:hypothetical protein
MPREVETEASVAIEAAHSPIHLKQARKAKLPSGPPASPPLLNREIGQLEFNRRVLAQAADPDVPLLERLRFLCIVSSNLDEFFEIRVAGLKAQIDEGGDTPGPDGIAPSVVFREVSRQTHQLVAQQYELFNQGLVPLLAKEAIRFLRRGQWNGAQRDWIKDYFFRELMPVLTPIGLDPAHPFPRILNKSLNFAVQLSGKDAFGRKSGVALVQAPRVLPRVIKLPREIAGCDHGFVFLSSVIHAHVGELFAGMQVLGCYQFRVTRNSDLYVDEEEIKNLRTALQGELSERRFGEAVRLETAHECPPEMVEFLLQQFGLVHDDLYQVSGPVNLVRLMQIPDQVDAPELKYRPFTPGVPGAVVKRPDMFSAIRKDDILLHHPYQSFRLVINFIEQAAKDAYAQAGVRHIVALRGDPTGGVGERYAPHPGGYGNAAELVAGIKRIAPVEVSVSAYPEKHPDSPTVDADIDMLKAKVDAGATRAITQFFFENALYFRYLDRVRASGIDIPVVPGILPVQNFKQTKNFAARCGASVPAWLAERFDGLDDDPATRKLAASFASVLARAFWSAAW